MINLQNITKYYRVQRKKKTIFDNFNFEFKQGENIAILGPNGAGKSTLLRMIAGSELPNAGKIVKKGSVSWPLGMSGSFQDYLTGKENVQFICRLYSPLGKDRVQKIKFIHEFSELGDYFQMPVQTYSLGMRTRLGIATSMAFHFDFYIIDELLSAGDLSFRNKCKEAFKQKFADSTVIMVSHDTDTLASYCQKGIYLDTKINQETIKYDIDQVILQYKINLQ